MKRQVITLIVIFSTSMLSTFTLADGKHSPLLMLISNKLKIEKLISEAEQNPQRCKENGDRAWQLMKPSLHMLKEYTEEKEGNYISQQAYASSLEQRAKMLDNFSKLLDRVFHIKADCMS